MDFDILSKVIAAIVPLLVAALSLLGGRRSNRGEIKEDLEMLAALPEGSGLKPKLEKIVETQLDRIQNEIHYTRNLPMIVVAIAGSGIFIYLGIYLFQLNTWWWTIAAVLSVLMASIFMYGIFESVQKKDRRKPPTPASSQ
ncbi:hypothetical protein M1D89_15800 [Arthrobacter sp. D3-18]